MRPTVLLVTAGLTLAVAAASAAGATPTAAPKPIPGIRSPSGNIRCLYVPPPNGSTVSVLHCWIAHSDYAAELQHECSAMPAGLDWHGFELTPTRKGGVTCSGGILYDPATQRPVYSALAYGATWRHGAYTCASRRTGITCKSTRGHGLFVSRQSWRAF